MRDDGAQLVQALTARGKSANAFLEADRVLQTMASTSLQYQNQKAEMKLMRMQVALESRMGLYNEQMRIGQMSATEYIQRQREHAGLQITMYAQEIAMIESANMNYLRQHQQDMGAFMTHCNLMHEQIVMSMQVDAATIANMRLHYDAMMKPLEEQLLRDAEDLAERGLESQERQNMWSNAIAILGTGIDAIFGGIGAIGNIGSTDASTSTTPDLWNYGGGTPTGTGEDVNVY